ncbi:hypothetical protein Ciccas_005192 [Cichlidogyrus casuarinus]|uniref:PMP-22/EMP/MP20/Claudin tight junction n=1 Tax=Cichlidogyrus casuarinus TaxID=1844966 RepID=A0ABD2Q9C1_9PLAT
MNSNYEITQMYMPLYAAFVTSTIGFLFFMFGFGSPYWIQSYKEVHSSFLHMGLWSICFDDFVHAQDYAYNHYTGCYWIFDRLLFKTSLWFWANPYVLIAIQVMVTAAFLVNISVMIVLVLYFLLFGQPASESTMAFYGQLVVAILLTISTCLFGYLSQQRWWMYRPDHQFLAWAFGFIVLAALCSYVAAAFLYCVSYTDRASQREVEMFEEVGGGAQSTLIGGPYAPSMMTGMNSQYGGASVFGGTGSKLGGVTIKVPTRGGESEIINLNTPVAAPRSYEGASMLSGGPGNSGFNKPGSLIGSEYGAEPRRPYYPNNQQLPYRDQSPYSEEDLLSDGGYDQQHRRLLNR